MRVANVDLGDRDLTGIRLSEAALQDVRANGASLRTALLSDSTIERLDAPALDDARSRWRTVVVSDSRVGSLAAPGTTIRSLSVCDAALAHVDLSGAELDDVDDAASLRGATLTSDQLFALRGRVAAALGIRLLD